jgi:polyhydroxyalkanoate synthesis regulator phasin
MTNQLPRWKRLFDTLDRTVGTRVNELAQSEEVAALTVLGHRSRTGLAHFTEHTSRRVLHALNLPAGSDVNRLLSHIASLEREVRDLRNELADNPSEV